MAASNLSPPTLMEEDLTTLPREVTSMLEVPAPMSRTMAPLGEKMSMPAPMAAAMGSSMR